MMDKAPLRDGPVGRRRARQLEDEVEQLTARVDALVEAVMRMAPLHYRSPLMSENSLSSALHDGRRR